MADRNEIFIVEASSGSWDDYGWWIEGVFTEKELAEAHRESVLKRIGETKVSKSPIKGIERLEDAPEELSMENFDKIRKWEDEKEAAEDFNGCTIVVCELNTPFTGKEKKLK